MSTLVKLNTQDFTPEEGITLDLAEKYSAWLADLPIDGLEVSCGTLSYSMFNMVRGDVPTEEIIMNFPWRRKIIGKMTLKKMEGKFELEEGYNLEAAKRIKPVMKGKPLFLVGGLRQVAHMENVLNKRFADFISMSRPFIREPNIVEKIKAGKTDSAACVSCNKCFANVTFQSRSEVYKVIFGTFMIIIGLVALAFALYRWNPKDLSLISFGAFCFVYGARSSAIQFLLDSHHLFWAYWRWFHVYLTPVPVWIFFEQVMGKGWKSSIRRIWQIQIIFVIAAISVGLFLRSPGAAWEANNVMAIVGILVVGINLFRSGQGTTRELLVLKCGGVGWAVAAFVENISPLLTPGYNILKVEPFGFFVFLGWNRFKKFITSHANLSVGIFADGLIQHISRWSGKRTDEAFDDDLTLVVADFENR